MLKAKGGNIQQPTSNAQVRSCHRLTGMNKKLGGELAAIRYSEAFKMSVVREVESRSEAAAVVGRKYGVKSHTTVQGWIRKYGNGSRGKVIRVEKPEEIDQMKQLKDRVRRLEQALGTAQVDLALERAYTEIACERAGITDVAGFKKKAAGSPGIGR